MSYEEALTETVTRQQAIRELVRHGVAPEEFFAELGDKEIYEGSEVLFWLGY